MGSVSPAPRFVGLPLSRWLGVRDQARKPLKPNPILEKHFLTEGGKPKEVRARLHRRRPTWPPCGCGQGGGMWLRTGKAQGSCWHPHSAPTLTPPGAPSTGPAAQGVDPEIWGRGAESLLCWLGRESLAVLGVPPAQRRSSDPPCSPIFGVAAQWAGLGCGWRWAGSRGPQGACCLPPQLLSEGRDGGQGLSCLPGVGVPPISRGSRPQPPSVTCLSCEQGWVLIRPKGFRETHVGPACPGTGVGSRLCDPGPRHPLPSPSWPSWPPGVA